MVSKEMKMIYDAPSSRCVALAPHNCLASSVRSNDGLPDYNEFTPEGDWVFDED